jgi:hypothetical protein
MKAISRTLAITLSAAICGALFVSNAWAGCGDLSNLQGPFVFPQASPRLVRSTASAASAETAYARGPARASIVGLWNVQFLSQGNTGHNPSIPDGALIDWGFNQWHSDGTELLNSGGHAANTGNFCMGVWGQTGFLMFELNHYALSYDATSGALANIVNIREQVTLSPSGDSYNGTFTLDVYDPNGSHVDHVAGNITATRVTVDTLFTTKP